MRISDWNTDVCASDLARGNRPCRSHPGATGVTGKAQSRPGALLQKRELPGKVSARTLRVSGRTVSATGNRRWINDLRLARILRLATTRSEEHTSELQSLMRISYAVFCLNKKKDNNETYEKK